MRAAEVLVSSHFLVEDAAVLQVSAHIDYSVSIGLQTSLYSLTHTHKRRSTVQLVIPFFVQPCNSFSPLQTKALFALQPTNGRTASRKFHSQYWLSVQPSFPHHLTDLKAEHELLAIAKSELAYSCQLEPPGAATASNQPKPSQSCLIQCNNNVTLIRCTSQNVVLPTPGVPVTRMLGLDLQNIKSCHRAGLEGRPSRHVPQPYPRTTKTITSRRTSQKLFVDAFGSHANYYVKRQKNVASHGLAIVFSRWVRNSP